ncbi:chemotaxis protein MotA [Azorhizobium oxalatiphilum]|uniref:Chemotaxis protein MotA n=1 Tax=Azorhizobium oxalatiphilum TaxID=980631 RepID=A0A917BJ02_9HYPH|nr:flagellar motor stator protein MotA [Azorhizobium oxalatiphilum]GGF47867.1 chemotaxis protein MotA [Azorhizobium oxalatiphilum]
MSVLIGIVLGLAATFGGFMAMGGHLDVVWQPFEYVIIGGIAFSTFLIANPMGVIKDTGRAIMHALSGVAPKRKDFLALLGLLYALMREVRSKPRNEVEAHIDDPANSGLFAHFPTILRDKELTQYICDYARLIIIGNAKSHEIEALMEQEIATIKKSKLKPYSALNTVAEALPALGICAAVLGIVKAMGAIDQSPEILGHYIGSALIGTFVGIYSSYAIVSPLAHKIKSVREKQCQPFVIVKQTLIAFMNGALPQIALEHGRKTITEEERPTIDEVESEAISNVPSSNAPPQQQAA